MAEEQEKRSEWGDRIATVFTQRHPMLGAILDTDESDRMYRDRQRAREMAELAARDAMAESRRKADLHNLNMERGKQALQEGGMRLGALPGQLERAAERERLSIQAQKDQQRRANIMEGDNLWQNTVNNFYQSNLSNAVQGVAEEKSKKALAALPEMRDLAQYQAFLDLSYKAFDELTRDDGGPTPIVDMLTRQASALGYRLYMGDKGPMLANANGEMELSVENMQKLLVMASNKADEAIKRVQLQDSKWGRSVPEYYARKQAQTLYGADDLSSIGKANELSKVLQNTDSDAWTVFSLLNGYQGWRRMGDSPEKEMLGQQLLEYLDKLGMTAGQNPDGMGFFIDNPGRNFGLKDHYDNADEFFADLRAVDKVTPMIQKQVQADKNARMAATNKALVEAAMQDAKLRKADADATAAEIKKENLLNGGNTQSGVTMRVMTRDKIAVEQGNRIDTWHSNTEKRYQEARGQINEKGVQLGFVELVDGTPRLNEKAIQAAIQSDDGLKKLIEWDDFIRLKIDDVKKEADKHNDEVTSHFPMRKNLKQLIKAGEAQKEIRAARARKIAMANSGSMSDKSLYQSFYDFSESIKDIAKKHPEVRILLSQLQKENNKDKWPEIVLHWERLQNEEHPFYKSKEWVNFKRHIQNFRQLRDLRQGK